MKLIMFLIFKKFKKYNMKKNTFSSSFCCFYHKYSSYYLRRVFLKIIKISILQF